MRPFLPLQMLVLAGFALTGCLTESSAPQEFGEPMGSSSYTVAGDRLVTAGGVETIAYCEGSSLKSRDYPYPSSSIRFAVERSTLNFYSPDETLLSGTVVRYVYTNTRVGTGTGLAGIWKLWSKRYMVVSGTLDDIDRSSLEESVQGYGGNPAYLSTYFEYADGKVTTYVDWNTAKEFVDHWNGTRKMDPPAAGYDVEAKVVDKHSLEMQGGKTGEKVTILLATNGDRIFSSDNPAHARHEYRTVPVACPNDMDPDWYLQFLTANIR